LVYDTIVRDILPKQYKWLESYTVYVLVTDNKFDFYNITEIAEKKYKILEKGIKKYYSRVFTIHQLAHFLIIDLGKGFRKI
jgi:hypothetical protein